MNDVLDEKRKVEAMFALGSRYAHVFRTVALITAGLFVTASAKAQVLFNENFDDAMLATNAMVNEHVTIENGIARFNDPPAADPTPDRATFVVVQNFTDPVMTFSFDVVEPIRDVAPGTRMEMLFRAGVGTGNNTLGSGDQIIEAILFRGVFGAGNRGDYENNGNETIFVVANNKSTDLTFTSPIDNATPVTLPGFHYIPYVRNNETETFGQIKGVDDFNATHQAVFGTFNRFGIGSSSNADVGTFAIDNVLVVSGVSFEQEIGPPPVFGDVDGDGIGGEFPDDFDPIRANFRKNVSARTDGDLVQNGIVDFADFDEWKTAFLSGGGSLTNVDFSFLANVPEPASAGLAWAAVVALIACTNRRGLNSSRQASIR